MPAVVRLRPAKTIHVHKIAAQQGDILALAVLDKSPAVLRGIDKKTADAFQKVGISTVREFLLAPDKKLQSAAISPARMKGVMTMRAALLQEQGLRALPAGTYRILLRPDGNVPSSLSFASVEKTDWGTLKLQLARGAVDSAEVAPDGHFPVRDGPQEHIPPPFRDTGSYPIRGSPTGHWGTLGYFGMDTEAARRFPFVGRVQVVNGQLTISIGPSGMGGPSERGSVDLQIAP